MNICVYPRLFGGHAVSELQSKNLKEPLNILWNLKPLKNWSLSLYILILLIHLRYVLYISLYTVPHFSFFFISFFFVTILYLILYFWRGIFHSAIFLGRVVIPFLKDHIGPAVSDILRYTLLFHNVLFVLKYNPKLERNKTMLTVSSHC